MTLFEFSKDELFALSHLSTVRVTNTEGRWRVRLNMVSGEAFTRFFKDRQDVDDFLGQLKGAMTDWSKVYAISKQASEDTIEALWNTPLHGTTGELKASDLDGAVFMNDVDPGRWPTADIKAADVIERKDQQDD